MALAGVAKTELDAARHLEVQMEQDETKALAQRVVESTTTTRSSIILLTIGALLLFVLLAAVYYLIRHDVKERRRVADELHRRGELLEAANKELEAFSYSVSHDLRAPLRHIDGYASLLAKAATVSLDDKAKRYLQTISESATRMGQLIDDLLVFSRMGRQEMLHGTVNLNQLIASVLHDLRHDLQDRAISWTIAQLPEVTGDAAMLRQVFANLVSNAIKFTGTRPQANIEIGSRQGSQEEAVVFVRDNGVGFDMRYANKLFGVFQRLHRADEFEGTGIGLANVRRIIHRHGGKAWAEGTLGEGATFFVSLPITRPDGMTSSKPILLAEDNPRDAELALAAMEEHHLADKVILCHDGAEVLDYLYCRGHFKTRLQGNPAVVLLDLKMPKVDGLEVLRTIKGDAALKPIPVVMLTSSREERDLVESYALGANAYVVKPVEFHQFLKAVKELGVFWGMINEPPPEGASRSGGRST